MSMFLSVPVAPDTMARLEMTKHATGQRDIQLTAGYALKRGAELPEGRVVLLSGEALERIEQVFQGGSVLNGADLAQKVERQAGISFLHVRLPFTPGQLEELQGRAERQGLTVEQLVERAAGRIYEQFFNMIRV